MSLINYKTIRNISSVRSKFLFLYGFAFLLAFTSCNKKSTTSAGEYSDAFKAIIEKADKLFDKKKSDVAIRYLDSAFRQMDQPTANERFRFHSVMFVYYRRDRHDVEKAMLYADTMLSTAQKTPGQKQYIANYAEALFAKGDAYFDDNQYSNAYRCFYEGYSLGKNHLDKALMAEYTYRMGIIMFRQSHYKLAADFFKESYVQSFGYHDDFRAFYQRQELLNDIGESYSNNGNIDSAGVYYNKALEYIDKNKERFKALSNMLDIARAVVYGDQGKILFDKGQIAEAKTLLQKSIAINSKKFNDNSNAELVEINLAQLYLNTHNYSAFLALMSNLDAQLKAVKNDDAQTEWNKLMSSYYKEKRNFAKSLNYYTRYNVLKDSVSKASLSLRETDVNQQVANYDKQYQIENLREDNKTQLLYLYFAMVTAVLAVIIILMVYKYWRRSKRDVLAVNAFNKQISSQKNNLETTLKELNTLNQEKDRILRTVAHDLRNPIGGIASLTNMMAQEAYTDEHLEMINLIKETSYNSLELINEILEVANNGTDVLNKELADINLLLNNSVELLRFKAAEKGQQIILEMPDMPEELLISREKIWRVISNLISNAIKFSPAGSPIKVKIEDHYNEVEISVKDDGIGIPDAIKNKVFNIFTEAKRTGTAGEKSFGLGLSICRQIIENHDGKIWFSSEDKAGTTFFVRLPKPVIVEAMVTNMVKPLLAAV